MCMYTSLSLYIYIYIYTATCQAHLPRHLHSHGHSFTFVSHARYMYHLDKVDHCEKSKETDLINWHHSAPPHPHHAV